MGTSVPSPSFTDQGFVPPAESDVVTGVQADMNGAFGGNLNLDPKTPQGQLVTSTSAIVGDKNDQFCALANGVDPARASGRMQDAIGRIYFIDRQAALPTSVSCTIVGAPGTPIPTGALAQATDGNLYFCTAGGTIPAGGSLTLQFQCQKTGPIACPASSLSTIYQAIPGWDTITNPADGVIGRNVETRAEFEQRRKDSVAKNALGSNAAVLGAILDVANVLDAYVIDNPTGGPLTIGSVTIPAGNLFCCVAGGDPQAVANAVWTKKMPGCPMYGTTTETVYDTVSGYSPPLPSYAIKFTVATPTALAVAVTVANSAQVPTNALAQIQTAVLNAFTGADNGTRARIASTLYASRYYAGVAGLGAWAQIVSIQIGLAGGALGNSLTMGINQVPTLSAANITLSLV